MHAAEPRKKGRTERTERTESTHHSAKESLGVDLLVDEWEALLGAGRVPSCRHGPCLLFQRYYSGRGPRKFFACSAARDRAECPAFYWADEIGDGEEGLPVSVETAEIIPDNGAFEVVFSLKKASQRIFCTTCQSLVRPDAVRTHPSESHTLLRNLSKPQMLAPSRLLNPASDAKVNAQFLFEESVVDFVLGTCKALGLHRIVCVGTPRIHEAVHLHRWKASTTKEARSVALASLDSILLDMDARYAQFYPPSAFAPFNMLTGHFFTEDGRRAAAEFLASADVILVDPPFGAHMAGLARTLKMLSGLPLTSLLRDQRHADVLAPLAQDGGTPAILPVMMFFPYFQETQLCKELPCLTMTDFRVDYENHRDYRAGKGKSGGSPVRIFTNIRGAAFRLPQRDGYRFCDKCERSVLPENKHCDLCKCCPSKNGQKYRHCDACGKCVKPGYKHCVQCGFCSDPQSHSCGVSASPQVGCHLCHAPDHRRSDCPQRQGLKRKETEHAKSEESVEVERDEEESGKMLVEEENMKGAQEVRGSEKGSKKKLKAAKVSVHGNNQIGAKEVVARPDITTETSSDKFTLKKNSAVQHTTGVGNSNK